MTLFYRPRGDRIIVERVALPEAPAEGLVIPKSQQKPLDEGIVVAVGPEITDITRGQHVCFLEYARSPILIDGKEYLSMRDEEVHGVRLPDAVQITGSDWHCEVEMGKGVVVKKGKLGA